MAAFTGQHQRVATASWTRYAAGAVHPATCCRASVPLLRPACSSADSGTPAGGSRRRRQAKPCLQDLALQECQLHKATAYSLPAAVHHALPAFVRKFVLRHPSAAQLLHEFDSTYLMVLQCPLPAKHGAAGEASAPAAAADAASTSRLLSALTPRQRAAAHLCRVADADVYFDVYLLAFAQGRGSIEYEDPWGWVTLLHVPPALRGQGLGRAMLDCLTKEFDCEPRVPASALESFEHWG